MFFMNNNEGKRLFLGTNSDCGEDHSLHQPLVELKEMRIKITMQINEN